MRDDEEKIREKFQRGREKFLRKKEGGLVTLLEEIRASLEGTPVNESSAVAKPRKCCHSPFPSVDTAANES